MEYLDITKVENGHIHLSNKDVIFFTRGNWWAYHNKSEYTERIIWWVYHNKSKYTERIIATTVEQAVESYQDRQKVAIVNTDLLKGTF